MVGIIKYYFSAFIAILFWGTTFALSKFLVPNPLSSITFTGMRTMLGLFVLLVYLILTHQIKEWWRVFKRNFKSYLIIGLIFYSMAYIFQYIGIIYTTAINQSIISNTQPFWVVILNLLIYRRKPKKKFLFGLLGAFLGLLFIILNDNFSISQATIKGDLISIFAFFLWASYTFATKPQTLKEKPIFVTTSIILCANFLLFPLMISVGGINQIILLDLTQWLILIYLGIFCIGVSFITWNYALSHQSIPSENIALMTLLNPVVGIITSILLLSEILTIRIAFGFIIVFISLIIAEFNPRKKTKTKESLVELDNHD